MTDFLTLTSTLRLTLALLATTATLYFLASKLRSRLGVGQYGVIGLTVLTAAIHLLSGANDMLLYLNGVGYLVLLTLLYFAPLGPLEIYRRWLYGIVGAYVSITIGGYFVVHPWGLAGDSLDWLGWTTKAVELGLLGLLAFDYARGGQPVQRPTRTAPAQPVVSHQAVETGANGHHPPASKSAPALEVKGLQYSYPDKPGVLKNVTVTIQPKERVGLIGPNGAGKTTFFMSICGVQRPESGEINLFGRPMKHRDFRPEIGMVFQKSDDQLFSPSVYDDVAFGPQNLGLRPEEIKARVQTALTTTGVLDLADRPPHHLSGGEKRMVSIAGVLAMAPQLVIYDEPSANLDIRARRRLIEFLKRSEQAFLLSSHDLELILEVCDRVLLLDDGAIIADGKPSEVMSNVPLMESHGLERPHSLTPHFQLAPVRATEW